MKRKPILKLTLRKKRLIPLFSFLGILFLIITQSWWLGKVEKIFSFRTKITKDHIASALEESLVRHRLPDQLVLNLDGHTEKTQVAYAFDENLQKQMEGLFNSYKPDYGAFVAIDATTGRVLSLMSYNPIDPWIKDHLALRATFPSASVFKVVTAAAAIAEKKLSSDSIVSFNGRAHTLYKSNVFKDNVNRWTNHMTLKEAFAHSVNTVFGKLGVFIVGPTELRTYADRSGFNRKIHSDLPIQQGKAEITEDPWEIAETASGYTRTNTMSPLQGALIAATIANDGTMMEPYVVDNLKSEEGEEIYHSQPIVSAVVTDPRTANEMKELMRETITGGTSRGAFRGFKKSAYSFVDVGGKTGSLTGMDPAGKYDWFVGYAMSGEHRIALATLTISKEYWKVKSAFLTRRAIEIYFKQKYGLQTIATRAVASRSQKSSLASNRSKKFRSNKKRK